MANNNVAIQLFDKLFNLTPHVGQISALGNVEFPHELQNEFPLIGLEPQFIQRTVFDTTDAPQLLQYIIHLFSYASACKSRLLLKKTMFFIATSTSIAVFTLHYN